jgi:hypothetical protein
MYVGTIRRKDATLLVKKEWDKAEAWLKKYINENP